MNKVRLLNDIIERVPGNVLDAWMRKHDIEPEWARENNKSLLHSILKSDKPHDIHFSDEIIAWYKKEILFSGDRILSLYRVENDFFDLIANLLDQLDFKQNDIFKNYSIECPSNFSESAHIQITKQSIDFVYRNTTFSKIRMDGKISELTPEARDQYGDDASLVVYKTISRCFYNFIRIRNDGWIELRIDNACLLDGKKGTLKSRFEDFLPLKAAFERDISAILKHSFTLPAPENVFPAIEKIYHAKTEGRIRHLLFTTSNSGKKELTTLASNANHCLRSDTYHHNGEKALSSPISPYRLILNWDHICPHCGDSLKPELHIPGTIYHLRGSRERLNYAILENIGSSLSYDMIVEKLIKYLLL